MDYGLLGGLAEGIKAGFNSYRDERKYQQDKAAAEQQKALNERLMQMQMLGAGVETDPEGKITKTSDQINKELDDRLVKEAGLRKAGYQIDKDPVTGKSKGLIPIPGYHDTEEEERKAKIRKLNAETAQLGNSGDSNKKIFQALPMENQKQVELLAADNAKKTNIKNSLEASLQRIDDPKVNEEQKLVHARSMIKLLNSQVGQDAVGAEEAKRLAGLLEFRYFNLTEPGPVVGRAPIGDFAGQVRETIKSLGEGVSKNESDIQRLYGRSSLSAGKSPDGLLDIASSPQGRGLMGQDAIAGDQSVHEDNQAVSWAKKNPNDPRAKKILLLNGVK